MVHILHGTLTVRPESVVGVGIDYARDTYLTTAYYQIAYYSFQITLQHLFLQSTTYRPHAVAQTIINGHTTNLLLHYNSQGDNHHQALFVLTCASKTCMPIILITVIKVPIMPP